MDELKLTELFIRYAQIEKERKFLEAEIQAAVLALGETRKIAGVTATYYKPGFATPDYEAHAKANIPDGFDLDPYTTVSTSTRWKEVCEAIGSVPEPTEPKAARVAIKA